MTNRFLVSLTSPAIALLLASCSFAPSCGNSHPYKNYVASGPIKAPAGVTVTPVDPAYKIPAAGTAAAPAAATNADPCLVTPPSVLTKQDMAKPLWRLRLVSSLSQHRRRAPRLSPSRYLPPAASTQAPATPAPASPTHPRPVAGTGSME